jgi:hypothetical protein
MCAGALDGLRRRLAVRRRGRRRPPCGAGPGHRRDSGDPGHAVSAPSGGSWSHGWADAASARAALAARRPNSQHVQGTPLARGGLTPHPIAGSARTAPRRRRGAHPTGRVRGHLPAGGGAATATGARSPRHSGGVRSDGGQGKHRRAAISMTSGQGKQRQQQYHHDIDTHSAPGYTLGMSSVPRTDPPRWGGKSPIRLG